MNYILEENIICTKNEKEVKLLKNSNNEPFNNLGFWNQPVQNFNIPWFWYVAEGDKTLSGEAGYGEPFELMERLNRPLILFNQYSEKLKSLK